MIRGDIQINLLWFVIIVESFRLQSGVLGFQNSYHPAYTSTCLWRNGASITTQSQSPSNQSKAVSVCCWSTKSTTNRRNRNLFPKECLPPTIQNPITKRKIQVGGPTFNEFLRQGKFVQHEGTLKRLDLEALRDFQQGICMDNMDANDNHKTTPCYREESDPETATSLEDEWYSITPLRLVSSSMDTLPQQLDPAELHLIRQQLLFVNKPSGLHCVPARDLSFDCLSSQVVSSLKCRANAKPCHRLDRDTSGLVIFGMNTDAHRVISQQFEARTTSKTYTALIAGIPSTDQGIVELPIGKFQTTQGFNRWVIGGDKPRDAVTTWRVDATFTDAVTGATFSRVELEPKTGRGHQLRLHMKAMGHPILGDTLHGEGGVAYCSPRLCLHALKVQVDWNGQRLQAESVAPF
jgi:tRNA pseudouridine32 synthase/23S rRNA pseudouridine746 synthase